MAEKGPNAQELKTDDYIPSTQGLTNGGYENKDESLSGHASLSPALRVGETDLKPPVDGENDASRPMKSRRLPVYDAEDDARPSDTGERQSPPPRKISINPPPPRNSNDDGGVKRKITTASMNSVPKSILTNGDNYFSNTDGQFVDSYVTPSCYEQRDHISESWWFALCTKCRQKETGPGWEPRDWQSFCPYPFCPTYRHFARILCLFLLGFLAWGVVYSIAGDDAAPGGQLFSIALLCIVSNFGGWLARLVSLPPLVGMLLTGILWQNVGLIHIQGGYTKLASVLRKFALVVILTRAGLDLELEIMKKKLWTVLQIGLIPWLVECAVAAVLTSYILDLPWSWGILLGSVIAAVSPAVVVPSLIRYRNKGYGVAKGIPTIIIAISGIDDALSVSAFGIIDGIIFAKHSLVYEILMAPATVIAGVLFGILWGLLSYYVPERDDPFVVPMRILLVFAGGLAAVFGSESLGMDGAGPLACVSASFFAMVAYTKNGWDVEDNPVATGFEIFWMVFEPILFGLTGTQIKFDEMEGIFVAKAIGVLVVGIVIRIFATIIAGFGTSLNTKEKFFCGMACMSKASVQAALAPVVYDRVASSGGDEAVWAKTILLTCVLSILFSAPTSAIIIGCTGKMFLTKTEEAAPQPDSWRRSARPSLRDISIHNDSDASSLGKRSKRSSVVSSAVGNA